MNNQLKYCFLNQCYYVWHYKSLFCLVLHFFIFLLKEFIATSNNICIYLVPMYYYYTAEATITVHPCRSISSASCNLSAWLGKTSPSHFMVPWYLSYITAATTSTFHMYQQQQPKSRPTYFHYSDHATITFSSMFFFFYVMLTYCLLCSSVGEWCLNWEYRE